MAYVVTDDCLECSMCRAILECKNWAIRRNKSETKPDIVASRCINCGKCAAECVAGAIVPAESK